MAFGAAKDAVFKVANVSGTLTDISAYLTSITAPSLDAQTAEVSTLGDAYKEFIRTQVDPGSISVEGIFDPVIGTLLANLGTASERAFEYYPQGTATGKPKYSGSALLTSFETGGGIDDAVTFSAELQVTGAMTFSVA
jgi:hypothetical protein